MRTRIVVWVAVCAWLVVGCLTSAQQTTSGRSQHSASKTSGLPEEDKLRMHLQVYPHDADTHKKLIRLLHEKYAFRAIVAEDRTGTISFKTDAAV